MRARHHLPPVAVADAQLVRHAEPVRTNPDTGPEHEHVRAGTVTHGRRSIGDAQPFGEP